MANGQCSIKSECGKTSDEPYILNSSTFSSEEKNNFGEFRFDTNRRSDSLVNFSNDDCTVEWTKPPQIAWIPVQIKAKLHSGRWLLQFYVESMRNRQIEVGFLLD